MYQLLVNTNTEHIGTAPEQWVPLDIGDATIALTYQANDLAELKTREVNRSNGIKLPRTPHNDSVFGVPHDPQSLTLKPYRYLSCRLYDDGVEVFGKGSVLVLIETNHAAHEVTLKGSLFGFFDAIKELPLRRLDTQPYKAATKGTELAYTEWNVQKVANTRLDDAVVFPLIDWDANAGSAAFSQPDLPAEASDDPPQLNEARIHIQSQLLFPTVKLSALLQAISLAQGYTFSPSDELQAPDSLYTNAVVPVSQVTVSEADCQRVKNTLLLYSPFAKIKENNRHFAFDCCQNWDTRNPCLQKVKDSRYTYLTPHAGKYVFCLSITQPPAGSLLPYPTTPLVPLRIDYNTDRGQGQGSAIIQPDKDGNVRFYLTINLGKGEELRFNLQRYYLHLIPIRVAMPDFWFGISSFTPDKLVFPATRFDIVSNLPDLSQLDLFKGFCQLFGQVLQVDERERTVVSYGFNDIVQAADRGDYLDWTHTLDSREHHTAYRWNSYARRNAIAYKDDEAANGTPLRSVGTFTIDNHTLPPDKQLFELPFTAAQEVQVCGLTLAKLGVVDGSSTALDTLTETKPKLLYLKEEEIEVRYNDPNPKNDYKENSTIINATFSPICMEETVVRYYGKLSSRLLNRARLMKLRLWLTPLDLAAFDHRRPVYLAPYGRCFYLNRLSNYVPGKLTEAELVAIQPPEGK